MRKLITLALYLLASCALAQSVTPRKNFTFETSGVRIDPQPIEMKQATSADFYFTFKNDGYYMNFPANTNALVTMMIAPTNDAWTSMVTGTIDSATRGRVKIAVHPADINTNGVFQYDILIAYVDSISGVTNVLADATGPFVLEKRTGSGTSTSFPPSTNNPVDLSGVLFVNYPWVGGSGSTNTNSVTTIVYNKSSTFSASISGDILTMTYPSNINYFSTIGTNSWNGLFDEQEGVYYLDLANMTGTLDTAVADLIDRVGTVTSGTWTATAIADSYLTKTGNWSGLFDGQDGVYYLDVGNGTGTLASAVQDSITGLGTITGGLWNATAISDAYLMKTGNWTGKFDGYEAVSMLKTNTAHAGDVSGVYTNLQIGSDTVGLTEVDTDSLDTRYIQTSTNIFESLRVRDADCPDGQGSEHVVNGTFTNDAAWVYTGGLSYGTLRAEMLSDATGTLVPSNALSITLGKTYLIEAQKGTGASTNTFALGGQSWSTTDTGYVSNIVTVIDSSTNLIITMGTTASAGDWIDNISVTEITNGNLYVAGSLYIGLDFIFGGVTISSTTISNWDTAYGWGDWSTNSLNAGNLTGAIPVSVTQTEWDTAYGWGDHSTNSYHDASSLTGTIPATVYADCTNIWYVALCGDDANSGLTELTPKLTIQAAIDAAEVVELAGGGHQKIQIGGGDWTETNTLAKGISLYGSGRRATRLLGSLTIPTDYTGGEIKDFTFKATGTTGFKYYVPAGLTDLINIRLEDVGFLFTTLTNFTDTLVKIYSGNNIFNNVSLNAPGPDFTSMADSSGSFLVVTNGADLSMNYFQVIMEDVNLTNGTMNILDFRGTGNICVKNSSMDITLTNSFVGDFRGIKWSAPSGEHQMISCDIDIEGVDATGGDVDGAYVDAGTVRSSFSEINIDGFLSNHSYHRTTNTSSLLIVNFSSDTTEYETEGSDTFLDYIGSPQDGLFRTPLFQFGQNGQVYSAFPESPTLTGHNGTSWWNFCESKNAVYGEDVVYNNATIVIDDTEYQAQDSDGFSMGMTLTVDGWDASKGDGENADGTLFPAIVVKSEFETLDDETGTVTLAGCEIGETYVWEILGSANNASKDCTDMTYWIVGGGTGTVDVVDNTDTLVTITNVATTNSMILYCSSPNAGEDSFLNAIRISGPAGAGLDERYLRLDGQEAMTANLPMGNFVITNLSDGSYTGVAATKAYVDASASPLSPWTNDVNGAGFSFTNGGTITITNRIGIRTETPSFDLDVHGSSSLNGNVTINESGVDKDFRIESAVGLYSLFLQGSDGYLGLGTQSPCYPLEVSGAGEYVTISGETNYREQAWIHGTNSTGLAIGSLAGGDEDLLLRVNTSGADILFATRVAPSNFERMRITSDGNVGIGTNAPSEALEVVGNITASGTVTAGGVASIGAVVITPSGRDQVLSGVQSGNPRVVFEDVVAGVSTNIMLINNLAGTMGFGSATGVLLDLSDTEAVFNEASADIDFRVESDNSTSALFVQGSDGNVGIGTATPDNNLHVYDATANTLVKIESGDQTVSMQLVDSSDTAYVTSDGLNGKMSIGLNSGIVAANLNILKAGNIGIGTPAPDSILEIVDANPVVHLDASANAAINIDRSAVSSSAKITFETADVLDWYLGSTDTDFQGDGSEFFIGVAGNDPKLWIEADGNVGIGTTAPATALEINGALTLDEMAEPTDPADGKMVLWFSNGTGAGTDGDVLIKKTVGGVVTTNTIDLTAL